MPKIISTLTVLSQDRLETQCPQTVGQVRSSSTERVVLHANGDRRKDSNDEEPVYCVLYNRNPAQKPRYVPQSIAITVVPQLVDVDIGEAIDRLAKNNTEAGVNRTSH